MRDLPRGTVTFLFTDVEGSTRLLHELGAEAYAESLAQHRRVIREATAAHGGIEVDTQGDAFFIAFPTAPDALAAAEEAQQSLSVPVRMGLHTGAPLLTDEGYVGADVHEAARIASAGHGRQILVSASTAALLATDALRDLGQHRLKDLTAPVRIYQVGQTKFPPLKTLYRTNLPVSPSAFVGRSVELGEVREMLERTEVRLLTLTGPGGCGKTRLGLQSAAALADNFPHGVWWVPLAPLTDPAQVASAAARVLGAGAPLEELVADRRLLLFFDNFEHVVDAARDVAALLAACPNVKVLVSSRERLRITGEHVYAVPVLKPEDARSLFVERARAARSDFEPDDLVDELCRRLDDLPLALELAAARMSLLSSRQLLDRLGRRLDLLRGGRDADARQLTLRATIEWSYDLLDPDEKRAFVAMSVFRAPWTLDAAERVIEADTDDAESLLDKSLLRRLASGRLSMLEMIREFAAGELAARERDRLLARLLDYLIDVFAPATADQQYSRGPSELALAQAERPNVDAALAWAREARAALPGLRLVTNLEFYWPTHDPLAGRAHVDEFLAAAGEGVPPTLRAQALRLRGATYDMSGRSDLAAPQFEEAARIFRTIGEDAEAHHLMHRIANGALRAKDVDRAVQIASVALEYDRAHGRRSDEAAALGILANAAFARGELDDGARLSRESADVADSVGFTWWKGIMLVTLAEQMLAADQTAAALQAVADGLEALAAVDDRVNVPTTLALVAALAAHEADVRTAGLLWGALEQIRDAQPGQSTSGIDDYQQRVGAVRGREFDEARQRGRALTSEEAVERALAFARNATAPSGSQHGAHGEHARPPATRP